jgi:hypothetical protein
MSYQVTLNSRNVLVPLSLEDGRGERMNGPLSRLDAATALVIQVSAGGGFTQEFIPLRIGQDVVRGYSGAEWELWVQRAGSELFAYYLGIPDRFFAADADGRALRSLSVQVVGTSPLTGREDFSGGIDVTLQEQMAPPVIPGFLNLSERFFPALLPHNFIESHVLDVFEFAGKRQPVLMTGLQMDSADRVPVSLGKHWEPKNWIQAVVENLAAPAQQTDATSRAAGGYFSIKGGCFYGRNRKITHWFGGDIGLEEPGFRQAATEKIRSMGQSGNGAWVFWLEPQGEGAEALLRDPATSAQRRISIRHPMMHRLLRHRGTAPSLRAVSPLAEVDAGEAVAALSQVARVLIAHQDALLRAQAEPSHADWSERRNPMTLALEALATQEPSAGSSVANPAVVRPAGLEADIGELYRSHGETLRALESIFDETYGYSAWDAVGNPMRETLSAYLVENADPAAGKPAAVRAPA